MYYSVLWYSPSWVPNILEITTVGFRQTDLSGEGQTDKRKYLPNTYSRPTAETTMNLIGQNIPVICLHFKTTTNTHSPWCRRDRVFSCFRQVGTDQYCNPIFRLTLPGSSGDHEVLALVRPVVPYTLALFSKRAWSVMSPAPLPIGSHAQPQGGPSSLFPLSFTNLK